MSCNPLPSAVLALAAVALATAPAAFAQPTVVPTAEGQIGITPGPTDRVLGSRFESIRGQPGELILGGIFVFGGPLPVPPPAFRFVSDRLGTPGPALIDTVPSFFVEVDKTAPASDWSRNAAGTGDFVAFSFAVDGTAPDTMTVRIATFDDTGNQLVEVPVASNVDTFFDPAGGFNGTGVAVDDQGRVTVVYTELPGGGPPQVKAQRADGVTGALIGGSFPVGGTNRALQSVALLDPAGNRLIVPASDFTSGTVRGNVVDTTGPTPVVLPEFPISTTAAPFGNLNPAVAADPASGVFTVAWERVTGVQGNPVDVRARRFDALGNPVGDDFLVNTTTADAQGQPAVAYGPGGESVIVWAGDGSVPGDELDVFGQAYDAMGNPIGGEFGVNTATAEVQDRPVVRFLPEPDAQGRPQFVVAWRDVAAADGSGPNGTGTGYRSFSLDGVGNPAAIFADGFESGDTSSWSDVQP